MNRRIVALSLSLVGALIAAGCGGSDNSSRTRNDAIINVNNGDTNFTFVVDCFQDEAARASSKATAEEYWNNNVKSLEDELTTVNNIAVMPALSVAPAPREEFPDDATYEAEVARLQAEYESAKALEDVESKSKAERIARITADLEAAKTQRQKELEKIDALKLCVGDPGAGGLLVDPNVIEPCATSSSADVSPDQDNAGRRLLGIRVCDQASKVSIQNYDVSGNSLAANEQRLADGTNRVLKQSLPEKSGDITVYEIVTCSATGYLDTSLITVDDSGTVTSVSARNVPTPSEPSVVAFCGGTTPTTGDGESSNTGSDSTNAVASNILPTNDDGTFTKEAIESLNSACTTTNELDVKELHQSDGLFSADELLEANAALACGTLTTPQLLRVEMYVDAMNLKEDVRFQFGNGEQSKLTTGKVLLQLPEGEWKLNARFRLVFQGDSKNFQLIDISLPAVVVTVGPKGSDTRACYPRSFQLTAPENGVKRLEATCDAVFFSLSGSSTPFNEIDDRSVENSSPFPLKHKVGAGRVIHHIEAKRMFSSFGSVLVSCDDACVSDKLDSSITLTRSGDSVNFNATDRCAMKGPNIATKAIAVPYFELQPDLLSLQGHDDPTFVMGYSSVPDPGFDMQFGRTSLKTGAPWYVVTSYCHPIVGPTDEQQFESSDWQSVLVKLDDVPTGSNDETLVGEESRPTSVPVANIVTDGALLVGDGVTSVAISTTDIQSLLETLNMPNAQVAISYDDSAPFSMSYAPSNQLLVPEKAKLVKLSVTGSDGTVKVMEYPVVQTQTVGISAEGVVQASTGSASSSNTWIYVMVATLLALVAIFVASRRKLAMKETTGEAKD